MEDITAEDIPQDQRQFRVEGWGEVGYANLWKFVPNAGEKWYGDLKVGESCYGRTTGYGPDKITRTR